MISVAIDFLFYNLFQYVFGLTASLSKIISFIMGATNSFFFNKIITFKSRSNSISKPIKFITLYLFSLIMNSYAHNLLLAEYENYIPFIGATLTSVVINFSGQKLWVFKK